MKNGDVTPIGEHGITPEVLAYHIVEDVAKFDEIYVIAFTKTGEAVSYISGSARGMTLAAVLLQDHALQSIGKEL